MIARAGALALLALALLAPSALGAVEGYQQDDYQGFRNILPPGQGETINATELAQFQGNGDRPVHFDDQRKMYQDLVYETPGLASSRIDEFFKDASFGVKAGDEERSYSPPLRPGVTIKRDGFGVPHVYGDTRADTMYGAGYVGAEDRLFFMDVLRHAGRAQLSEFAGGANKAMDREQWDVAPYTEQDLQHQIDLADEVYGQDGVELRDDLDAYVAGINGYIAEANIDPTKKPGEYLAIGKPLLPWQGTDVIATATLIGGIFGKGGGGEVENAEAYQALVNRFGQAAGTQAWSDFREANDPEAPTTVHGQSFPYQPRQNVDQNAVAMPDNGSLGPSYPKVTSGSLGNPGGLLGGLGGLQGASNALLVSGAESESGHPVAVMGPQVAYFAPEILMEEDLHGPDIDARGATFTGVNLYVLLGRGQDFAWSATSAGQDIIDSFGEELCEPGGGTPTIDSMGYIYKGQCRDIEVLTRTNNITPNPFLNDNSPPETYTLRAERTVHGPIHRRGMVNGEPVAFTKLRSTYFHEADSARAFSAMNRPSKVQNATDFQRVMSKINFTFNWFYADDRDIAYFNSGDNPVRADGVDPEFPTWGTGDYDWRGWDPDRTIDGVANTNIADYTPFEEHPRTINQDYLTSWNNKQAPDYRAAEDNYSYGPVHRSLSLDERVQSRISGSDKLSLAEGIDAMEDAGTVDLRGTQALPEMLNVIGDPNQISDPQVKSAVQTLAAWQASAAHRRDKDKSGTFDETEAVRLMDAWWPRAIEGMFKPTMGDGGFGRVRDMIGFDDPPGELGSAYISGWFGYVDKDLRNILGQSPQGAFSRKYCGSPDQNTQGSLDSCRTVLLDTLQAALPDNPYGPDDCDGGDAQWCHDAVRFRTVGGVSVDPIHWINRPTFQQAVEVQGHRDRGSAGGSSGGSSSGGSSSGSSGGGSDGSSQVKGARLDTGAATATAGGVLSVVIACPDDSKDPCEDGKVTLKSAAGQSAKRRRVTIGSGHFSIPAGKRKRVRIRLTRRGKSLIRKKGRVRAKAKVRSRRGSRVTSSTGTLVIKAPGKRGK